MKVSDDEVRDLLDFYDEDHSGKQLLCIYFSFRPLVMKRLGAGTASFEEISAGLDKQAAALADGQGQLIVISPFSRFSPERIC